MGVRSSALRTAISTVARQVQKGLLALGYDVGAVDGLIGPRTRAAIRAFQADHGLSPTGKVSEELALALRLELAARAGKAAPVPK